ncbi:MAG: Permease [Gemmatimonadetes bacterium]|nr:Permease [Gemmatimonadota bacterium]
MSDHPRPTRFSRLLVRAYPRELRNQYADDIACFIDDARRDPRYRNNPFGPLFVATRLTVDALASMVDSWRRDAPRVALPTPPSESSRSLSMDAVLHDIRFALRGFIRRPAFTIVAVGTLMLGIGANTAIFTLVNSVLLQPLPYPHAEQLVSIWSRSETQKQLLVSVPDLVDMRSRNRTFADIGIMRSISVNLTGGDTPERLIGNFITASALQVLGAKTAIGRLLTDDETAIGAGQQVVVISYPAWQTRFGGKQDVLGRTVVLNGRPHVVVGVTSEHFADPYSSEVWLPISSAPSRQWFERNARSVWAVGRLKPGFTAQDGQRDLAAIFAQLEKEHPSSSARAGMSVIDMREGLVGSSRFTLVVLFGAVIAVLLIVCVNIANLQLVRASTRAREMSVRAALGANRGRLALQVIVESLMLSLVGGVLGVLLGKSAVKVLAGMMTLPATTPVHVDGWVLGFSLLVAVVTGLLFGAPAAFYGTRVNLQDALRARTENASVRRFSARNVLVVAELSLCIVLLAVAGLFTRSLQSLQHVQTGFNSENVLTAEFRLPSIKYDDSAKVHLFMASAVERLRAIPGVTSAALVDAVPMSGNFGTINYVAQGQPEPVAGVAPSAQISTVTDGYYKTMQIPVVAGRDFDATDRVGSEPVVIVNTVFANKAWPGEPAIGKTVRLLGQPDIVTRVVGVVGPVKQMTLSESDSPQLYLNMAQTSGIFASVVMRTVGDPDAMGKSLRAAIWSVDRDQPVWRVRSLTSLVKRDLSPATFSVTLVGAFAGLALLLGIIGVYGVMSFSVAQRTREVGIRMALGARGGQVLQLVLKSGIEVVVVAIVIGVAGALGAGRYLESQLYNVGGADPLTMLGVPLILAAVALVACWLPARRAARVDPAITLRNE